MFPIKTGFLSLPVVRFLYLKLENKLVFNKRVRKRRLFFLTKSRIWIRIHSILNWNNLYTLQSDPDPRQSLSFTEEKEFSLIFLYSTKFSSNLISAVDEFFLWYIFKHKFLSGTGITEQYTFNNKVQKNEST